MTTMLQRTGILSPDNVEKYCIINNPVPLERPDLLVKYGKKRFFRPRNYSEYVDGLNLDIYQKQNLLSKFYENASKVPERSNNPYIKPPTPPPPPPTSGTSISILPTGTSFKSLTDVEAKKIAKEVVDASISLALGLKIEPEAVMTEEEEIELSKRLNAERELNRHNQNVAGSGGNDDDDEDMPPLEEAPLDEEERYTEEELDRDIKNYADMLVNQAKYEYIQEEADAIRFSKGLKKMIKRTIDKVEDGLEKERQLEEKTATELANKIVEDVNSNALREVEEEENEKYKNTREYMRELEEMDKTREQRTQYHKGNEIVNKIYKTKGKNVLSAEREKAVYREFCKYLQDNAETDEEKKFVRGTIPDRMKTTNDRRIVVKSLLDYARENNKFSKYYNKLSEALEKQLRGGV